jgi:hypothetical protein
LVTGEVRRDATWQILEGDELIGEVRNCGFWDMFWTCGDFRAHGRFERDFRSTFDDFNAGMRGGDPARGSEALKTIRGRLHLVDRRGRRRSIFSLVIEGEHARFRLLDAEPD